MAPPSLNVRETRELLASLSLRPSRRLGQNFLIDGNIVRKSLDLAAIVPGDTVVEIGPGLGTLTRALLREGCRVYSVEKDTRLCRFLDERLRPEFPDRFHLLEGDAVAFPVAGLPPGESGSFKIVANLPYAISTPWLEALLATARLPRNMVLMLQQETAGRFTAVPGTKAMGAITVFLGSAFETAPGHRVPRQCFYPVPEVDSRLLNLRLKTVPYLFCDSARSLIRACFGRRRKQIAPLLRRLAPERDFTPWLDRLASAGVPPQTRPEAIPVFLWRELDRILREDERKQGVASDPK